MNMKADLKMNSKQRLMAAINRQQVDHIPLRLLMMYSSENIPFSWENQVERVEKVLEMGFDDGLWLEPPLGYVEAYDTAKVPGVKSNVGSIPPSVEDSYPLLVKEYETPEGTLRQIVRKTDDWPYGDDVYLFSDFNVSRSKEYIVKSESDLQKLKYLLNSPDAGQMEEYRKHAKYLRQEAERLGVVLEGGWTALGDAAIWLYGMENTIVAQKEDPELLEKLMDVLVEWELKRVDHLLDEGVDVIVHMAWYEGTDFWTPASYRKIIKPRLARIVGRVHQRGRKFRYIITKGWKPLAEDFVEIGIDCISGVDPVQDNIDLKEVKDRIGDKICLMGGVNSAVMLNQHTKSEIIDAVHKAFEILAPGGGFILYPVDQIFTDTPWSSVQVLVDAWRTECRKL